MIKTYENSIKKRFIQTLCLSQIAGIESSALVLAGPNALDYCSLIKKYIAKSPASKIYSYEKDMAVYYEQLKLQYSNKWVKNKVVFRSGDILEAQVQRVIDADFCCILKTAIPTVRKLFAAQQKLESTKCLMFTVSGMTREQGYLTYIAEFLEQLLDITINGYIELEMEYGRQIFLKYDATKYIIRVMTYADSSPMWTIQIIYK